MNSSNKFKSTVFYPKPKYAEGPSPMNQCIESGLPVFARDIGKDAKKAYMGCGYEHFCFNFYSKANDRTRHMYELLQPNLPTKIYLDFDHGVVGDKVKFEESSNKFIKEMLKVLTEQTGMEDIPFYMLDASTDKKLSLHVIFECFLENISTVKALVEHVLREICPCEYLDDKVYTSNRLFRILYSYKWGKDPKSALTLGGHEYNPFHVFKTMIQARIPSHYEGPFDSIKGDLANNVSIVIIKPPKSGFHNSYGISNVPSSINDFVAAFSDNGVVLSCKENESFITCVVGNKECPWVQRVHKHNNQYFTICKANMMGFFQCADGDCPKVPYGHVDVTCIWQQHYQSL